MSPIVMNYWAHYIVVCAYECNDESLNMWIRVDAACSAVNAGIVFG